MRLFAIHAGGARIVAVSEGLFLGLGYAIIDKSGTIFQPLRSIILIAITHIL